MYEEYSSHDVAVYGGYIEDTAELLQCSSGGIATALSRHMVEQGGYVVGVKYSDDFYSAEYAIVNTIDGIERFKGSKYIEVSKGTVLKDVKQLLDDGNRVLFFGLPCMVGALKMYLSREYDNLITCELACHGPTYQSVHKQYIEYLENKFDSKVIDFTVRKKKNQRLPVFLYAEFENGRKFQREFYSTEYGHAFGVIGREACYQCKFKGNSRMGDIMLGDFWSADKNDAYWNSKGVSVIFAETEKGNEYLKSVSDIKLFETSFDKAVSHNSIVIKPKKKRPEREEFERLFREKGLFYASHHTKKPLVRYIPSSLKSLLKEAKSIVKK